MADPERDIVERLQEAAGEATLKAWSVDVGKDKYQNASVLFSEAAQTIAALRAERDRCRDRSVVVMVGDTGHYVSQAVADQLTALRAERDELEARKNNLRMELDIASRIIADENLRAEAAEARVKELEERIAHKDECIEEWKRLHHKDSTIVSSQRTALDIAIRERDELRKALEPFSKLAAEIFRMDESGDYEDNSMRGDDVRFYGYNSADLTYGDLRRARSASSNREGGEE